MDKADTCAFRRILDAIAEKFGKFAYTEIYEDGSGYICDTIKEDSILAEFNGLGELATILEIPVEELP